MEQLMEKLIAAIRDIGAKLEKGAFSNEDQVSKGVVMRLLQVLGWQVFDPEQVSSEFRIANRKVDYALHHQPFGPVVLIEVKDVGKATAKGEEQLFDYCSKRGVPLAVLTDGRSWNFYFPAGMGSYEQRRFAVADLSKDDASDCARRLTRYLGFGVVVSGQSHVDAQRDYDAYRKQIVAKEQFTPALKALVIEADPQFVALFCDRVEQLCQIRPDEAEVTRFLRDTRFLGDEAPRPPVVSKPLKKPKPVPARVTVPEPPPPPQGRYSLTVRGKKTHYKTGKEVLAAAFRELASRDAGFCARYASRFSGRVKQYLAQQKEALYPKNPELLANEAVEVAPGWWLGTHMGNPQKERRVKEACEVAGAPYPSELSVHLPVHGSGSGS